MNTPNTVTFGSLYEGDMFVLHGSLFIKTVGTIREGATSVNAVYISDGDWAFFCDNEKVEPVNVEIDVRSIL